MTWFTYVIHIIIIPIGRHCLRCYCQCSGGPASWRVAGVVALPRHCRRPPPGTGSWARSWGRSGAAGGGGYGGGHPFPALAAPGLTPIRIQGRNASGAARRRRWRWEVPVCPVGQPAFGNARHRAGLFPDSARARHRGQRLPGAGSQQHCRSELEKKACPSPALSLGERLGGRGRGRVFLLPTFLNLSCVCLFWTALGTPWRQANPRKLWNFYDSACELNTNDICI